MAKLNIETVPGKGSFDELLEGISPELREVAHGARRLLGEVMPGVTEVPWARQRVAGYGVGPKKMSEHFCYIAPQSSHVSLGFMYGAELTDPSALLQGTGKLLRHVKLRSVGDVRRPELRILVEAASRHLPRLR
jgi:hypothetical protein